ncbi:MAG: PQQ-binding-like beta-propeller repeat protein [Candidatus Bathyarchaeota archaeon]|nr:PQQ-binding-like beta-propeller repeat protein [Candidatus Bathyarchaeota archaeon]
MKRNLNCLRKLLVAVVAMLLLSSTFALSAQMANASDPPVNVQTWTYVAVTNDPIGLNQQLDIVFWLNAYPPTAVGQSGDRWSFTVDVLKPDGTTDTLGPITSDPVGAGYVKYAPDQVGTYSVVAKFAEKTIDGTPNGFAPGYNPSNFGYSSINDTYLASASDPVTFVCQEQVIQPWQEPPIPSGYWTTPVNSMNRGWESMVANWLGGAAQNNGPTTNFGWGRAPESAHVLWTTPMWSGGIMDARFGDAMNYETIHYEGLSFNPIILDGRIYYNVQSLPREGWYCLNLYTGETEYFKNTTGPVSGVGGGFELTGAIQEGALSFGQILNYQSPNQMGGYPYLWSISTVTQFGGSTSQTDWRMYDAYSGNYICSIANTTSPLMFNGQPVMTMGMMGPTPVTIGATGYQIYGHDGRICYYNIVNAGSMSEPQYYLQVWNTSKAISYKADQNALESGTNAYWMWRPYLNFTFDGSQGFTLNVTTVDLTGAGSMQTVREGKYVIGGTAGKNNGTFVQQGQMWALNLDPSKGAIGSLLWNITFTPPVSDVPDSAAGMFGGGVMSLAGGGLSGGTGVDPEDGVFLFSQTMTRQWWGYSLETGEELWHSEPENQWSYYGMNFDIYDGMLLSSGCGSAGSELKAYDITTGEVLWTYVPHQVGFESPYGVYPITISCIADGKIYLTSREHHQIGNLWRGTTLRCVNATDGSELWQLASWGGNYVLSNGYLVGWNAYDNQIYCIGIGPSATTVNVQNDVVTKGNTVFIKGTVSDQSPGAIKAAKTFGYLNGVPAVSDADQQGWMEYLYEQQSMPADAQGVPVHLTAIDPNGNFQDLGTATTDIGGSYGIEWVPPVEGTYQVTATFAGSKSYGGSYATTQFAVQLPSAVSPVVTAAPSPSTLPTQPTSAPTSAPTQSPAPSPSEAPQPPTAGMPTETYIAIGAAILVVVAAAAALVLRRRK